MDSEKIKKEIKDFITKNGGGASSWYVGISKDPEKRLSEHHAHIGYYHSWDAETEELAREIEKYFIEIYGTKGGSGGGDKDSNYVYTYKIFADTDP